MSDKTFAITESSPGFIRSIIRFVRKSMENGKIQPFRTKSNYYDFSEDWIKFSEDWIKFIHLHPTVDRTSSVIVIGYRGDAPMRDPTLFEHVEFYVILEGYCRYVEYNSKPTHGMSGKQPSKHIRYPRYYFNTIKVV